MHHPRMLAGDSLAIQNGQKQLIPIIGYKPNHHYKGQELIQYPFEKVLDEVGGYLESSIAYMIAFALIEGIGELELFGVSMANNSEYVYQKANCEYLIGFARGKGMKVSISPGAPLLMSEWVAGRYGIDANHRGI